MGPSGAMTSDASSRLRSKNFNSPDAARNLGRGEGSYVEVAGLAVGRARLEPGWRWSADVKPLVRTASCQIHHFQMILEGRMGGHMDDGEEFEFGPGEVIDLPPGHDVWVVGDEPLVLVDMSGNSAEFSLPVSQARAVVTMLMTDIVDSTKTAAEVGDAAWRQRLANHNRLVRRQLERFGGREVDTTGDGFLAAFASAEAGLRAALSIHEAVASAGVQVRAGVHTADVDLLPGGNLRGIAVHEAARIMATAPGGSVYTSGVSRALAASSGLRFESVGMHTLKGIPEPVELFLVSG
jgi:class 3 adenylate cyclase